MTTPVTSELLRDERLGKVANSAEDDAYYGWPSRVIAAEARKMAIELQSRRSQPSGEPVVKALEWRNLLFPVDCEAAKTPYGDYRVGPDEKVNGFYWFFDGEVRRGLYDDREEAKAAAQADYEQRIRSAIEPSVTVKGEPGANLGVDRLAIAKAFHDGPLGADDHDFRADSKQGKWCLDVVDFFIGQSRLNAETGIKTLECSICGLPMPEGETMFKFHGHSGPCPQPAMLDTAYAAAVKALEGTSGDIGVGELERVVMAVLAAATAKGEPIAWRVKHGGGFTIWNSEANARNNADATNGTVEPLYASPPIEPAGVTITDRPTHRHKKRGTEYVLIGIGKMQAEEWYEDDTEYDVENDRVSVRIGANVDMREVAIYRSANDPTEVWVRPREEFEDGRFTTLTAALEGK